MGQCGLSLEPGGLPGCILRWTHVWSPAVHISGDGLSQWLILKFSQSGLFLKRVKADTQWLF